MRILVTGASGFAGSQLIPRLLADGHMVRGLARDPARVDLDGIMSQSLPAGMRARASTRVNEQKVDVLTGDVLSGAGLATALRGVEVAYYLIHSMERSSSHEDVSPFPERERRGRELRRGGRGAGVGRIVYLGGPTLAWTAAGEDPSARLTHTSPAARRSSASCARRVPDTVTLRASIVIGARSRSFRFLVRLVERMPVLALPPWRAYRTRPIDARDVIDMLAAAATVTSVAGQSLDVGGPDILSYGEMIERIAELMLLARPAVGLGVNCHCAHRPGRRRDRRGGPRAGGRADGEPADGPAARWPGRGFPPARSRAAGGRSALLRLLPSNARCASGSRSNRSWHGKHRVGARNGYGSPAPL